MKSKTKKVYRTIHKVLGLITGLVVFIVSITGCLWTFKTEIESLYSEYKVVIPEKKEMITASQVREIGEQYYPNRHIHGVLYGKPNEAIELIFYETEPEFYSSLFIHPYNGQVIHAEDHLSGFFAFVRYGHIHLWLPPNVGSNIVSISVLVYLVMIITGIIIWWPKNKKHKQQRLKFQWKDSTRWKRKNYDLHSIIGFYISSLVFTLAFTGCIMGFNWFYFIVFKATGGTKDPQFIIPENITNYKTTHRLRAIDALIPKLKKENPEAINYELHYPSTDSSSLYVEIGKSNDLHYNADYRFFDQYTLEEINTTSIYGKYKKADFPDLVIRATYDVHVGAIGGIYGKILAFIISLLSASLPVTGFLIWLGKRRKQKDSISSLKNQLVSRISNLN